MNYLSDLGEFRILDEIILPLLRNSQQSTFIGDDCSAIKLSDEIGWLVMTADAAPKPLVWSLGNQSFHSFGWYSVAINISDIASSGAKPLAILSSIEAPNDTRTQDFSEFFRGIVDASQYMEVINGGGNIRTAPRFACHITAIGLSKQHPITRRGSLTGDLVVVIGDCGKFASVYLKAKALGFKELSQLEKDILTYPKTQFREMKLLHEQQFIRAATDNSDGMLGAFWNIVSASNCKIELHLRDELLSDEIVFYSQENNINPWNLFFMWGDWNVVAIICQEKIEQFRDFTKINKLKHTEVGFIKEGNPEILGLINGKHSKINLIRNENFKTGGGSFNLTVEDHIKYMLESPIFSD